MIARGCCASRVARLSRRAMRFGDSPFVLLCDDDHQWPIEGRVFGFWLVKIPSFIPRLGFLVIATAACDPASDWSGTNSAGDSFLLARCRSISRLCARTLTAITCAREIDKATNG